MDFSKINRKKAALWIISVFAVCSLIFLGVQNISSVMGAVGWVIKLIMPVILGFAFALVLDVPLNFFESHIFTKTKKPFLQKIRRPLSFIISVLVILGVLAGVIILVIPELIDAIKVIVQIVTDFVNKLTSLDEAKIAELPFGEKLLSLDWEKLKSFDWKKLLDSAGEWLKSQGGTLVNTAFSTIGSVATWVVNIGVGLVFACYVVLNKSKLLNQSARLIKAWLPEKSGSWILYAMKVANRNFRNFIAGQSLEAMILGVLCMLGMLVLQIPYAPMVGALVGVTALIPVVGGFIGVAIGTVMILTVSPVKALIFVVFFIVLQNIEGNFIYPKVMGNRVKLPAMWILAAVSIGGSIAGPLGMLISVPTASTMYTLVRDATAKREKKLAKNDDTPVETQACEEPSEAPSEEKTKEASPKKAPDKKK